MEIKSTRATMQHGSGFEILDTKYGEKMLRVSVATNASDLDAKHGHDGAQIHMILIEKIKGVRQGVEEILGAASSGDSVVILCRSDSVFQAVLSHIGFDA